jgi:hypothetical protein
VATQNGRTVPEVLQDIVGNIQQIIRSEFLLAKTEVKEEVGKAAPPAKMMLVGAILGLYGLGFLLWTAVLGMATVMPMWLAALIVGVVLAVLAVGLTSAASKRLKMVNTVPERTIDTLKENVQWAKERIK